MVKVRYRAYDDRDASPGGKHGPGEITCQRPCWRLFRFRCEFGPIPLSWLAERVSDIRAGTVGRRLAALLDDAVAGILLVGSVAFLDRRAWRPSQELAD